MQKRKFITIIISIFLIQLISFVFTNEFNDCLADFFDATIYFLALITLLLYFTKKKKIKKSYSLTNRYFYVTIIVTWTILNVISFFLLGWLFEIDILQGADGWFPGLEYAVLPFMYEIELIVILILDFLWFIIKRIFKFDFSNITAEQKNKILKKIISIAVIVTCFLLLAYIITDVSTTLSYNHNINKIRKKAEIVFTYKKPSFSTYRHVYIDLDSLEATITNEGYRPTTSNLNEMTLDEIQEEYFQSNDYNGMDEVYNQNKIQCYLLKDNSFEKAIFIAINEEKYYIVKIN